MLWCLRMCISDFFSQRCLLVISLKVVLEFLVKYIELKEGSKQKTGRDTSQTRVYRWRMCT